MNTIPWSIIEAALPTLEPVSGGYTKAQRGLVTLTDGQKVFVKIAVDDQTKEWIQKERKAYAFLAAHDFPYAPRVISETEGGLALPDFSGWDWSKTWTKPKMDAVFRAMDALAPLGVHATDTFSCFDLDPTVWKDVPATADAYEWAWPLISSEARLAVEALVADRSIMQQYAELAATRPWEGDDLIHNDVRSDNFAFNTQTGEGLLVDLNWLCIGTKPFDTASLLVDMEQAGAVIDEYISRADAASMAYIMGYWLSSAAIVPDNENLVTLRLHQLESALTAHQLLHRITI
jgi:Ser/Thr protein kinase RdoA (MazF antagonist)